MPRSLTPCAQPGCPELTTLRWCDTHADRRPVAWASSTRSQHVTLTRSAERARAKQIMRRDAGICHVCHKPGADRIDHVVPLSEGGADDDTNLAPIHQRPCHDTKTAQESARARRRKRGG